MSKQLVLSTLAENKPAEVRIAAWQTFLAKMFEAETLMLNKVIEDDPTVNIPILAPDATPEQVAVALTFIPNLEQLRKDLKKKQKAIMEERKIYTSKMDAVGSRLMVSEKTYDEYDKLITNALLPLKQKEAAIAAEKAAKITRLNQHRQSIQINFNANVSETYRYISAKIKELYDLALDTIKAEDVGAFLIAHQWDLNPSSFVKPVGTYQDPEVQAIFNEVVGAWSAEAFASKFNQDLRTAFGNFALDKANIAEAKRIALEKQMADEDEIAMEETMQNQVAALDVKVEVAPVIQTKALKKVYVINMPVSQENQIAIMRAYFANYHKCMAEYRGADCFKVDCYKMGELLCLLKNKDNNFQPDGITFKQEDRL